MVTEIESGLSGVYPGVYNLQTERIHIQLPRRRVPYLATIHPMFSLSSYVLLHLL